MGARKVALYVDECLGRYGFPNGHPFGPARLSVFLEEANRRGLVGRSALRTASVAPAEIISLFHHEDFERFVRAHEHSEGVLLDGADTPSFLGCHTAAATVVGAAVDATRRLVTGEALRAFVPIAGLHHGARDAAAGFCIFNDIGVVIELLRREYAIQRVAYVDIDAHHGDGVYYAFDDDPALCFADIHQDGRTLYPGTGDASESGRGAAQGTKLNLPVPPGADDRNFYAAWTQIEAHLLRAQPEFIILQCGTDSIAGDPLTAMRFSAAAHEHATRRLCRVAEQLGHGRVLALGGGGYNLFNVAEGWSRVLAALLED
ncbi:MAG: acetoin utilization protein AcuC [Myxococcota bacterium]